MTLKYVGIIVLYQGCPQDKGMFFGYLGDVFWRTRGCFLGYPGMFFGVPGGCFWGVMQDSVEPSFDSFLL